MCQLGLADDSTIFVANHFSHHGFEGYEDFTPRAEREHFVVSYDGMTCSF
jgi:phosphoribosyl 1,2-cyclic phosphate phosphodiesterase